MAITTLDGLTLPSAQEPIVMFKTGSTPAVSAGNWTSNWNKAGGVPAAGSLSIGNTTSGAIPTKTTLGGANYSNPSGGALAYLAAIEVSASQVVSTAVWDRAWHAGSFTPTAGAYAGFTGATVPNRPTDFGYELWAEINTALSAAAHTLTITYVAQDGTPGRTATIVLPASAPQARMVQATLEGTDTGVRSISAINGSATPPTGSFNLLLLRRLAWVNSNSSVHLFEKNALQLVAPQVYDDTCFMTGNLATAGTAPNPLYVTLKIAKG